jgi:GT2 family glycosyltransferase
MSELPTISIVFLVYNRREELRISLEEMLVRSDYQRELIDVIVVDNASQDGVADMVREEFPDVELIVREVNVGVSGWNDGLARARGDLVLVLDDDCYLPGDGLTRAVRAMREHEADLVSFAISRHTDPDYRFNDAYRTGLLSFWGCAALMRREVVEALGGYDPQIFVWANELEFMIRFFDRGFRHLHAPDIVAVHMKDDPGGRWQDYYGSPAYRINAKHFAYIAGKLLTPRDAIEGFIALLTHNLRDTVRVNRRAATAIPETVKGFAGGLRHRDPVSRPEVSHTYRRRFGSFASPWWFSRPAHQVLLGLPGELLRRVLRRPPKPEPPGRKELYYAERARYYPQTPATLEI